MPANTADFQRGRLNVNKCYRPDDDEPPEASALSLPSAAFLELTPACNSACPGCSNSFYLAKKTNVLSWGPLNHTSWDAILGKLEPSVDLIYLTGGEPTLHPEFESIVKSVDVRGMELIVFTNGRWRAPSRLVSFLAETQHFRGFLISLHGASSATHDLFTGVPGSFEETIVNIGFAVRAGLTVSTSTVITRPNLHEFAQILDLSRDLGAEQTVFNRFLTPLVSDRRIVLSDTLAALIPIPQELRAAVQVIESLRTRLAGSHHVAFGPCIPQCFTPSSSRGCHAGEASLAIDAWGEVKPCTDSVLTCGNLMTQSLNDVWWSTEMQRWRQRLPSTCQNCTTLSACRAGCRALAFASDRQSDPLIDTKTSLLERLPQATETANTSPFLN